MFLGLDVGKETPRGRHYRSGKKPLDRALPDDEAKLRELYGRMKTHGPVLLVADQPATIGALPVAVALDEEVRVAYLPGPAMRRIANLHPGAKTDACDACVIAIAARIMPHTLRSAWRRCTSLDRGGREGRDPTGDRPHCSSTPGSNDPPQRQGVCLHRRIRMTLVTGLWLRRARGGSPAGRAG